jgi:hypothetical protein
MAAVKHGAAADVDQDFFGVLRPLGGFLVGGGPELRVASRLRVETPGTDATALYTSFPVATSASS